jgi:polysaccharide biosynthesis transport protein
MNEKSSSAPRDRAPVEMDLGDVRAAIRRRWRLLAATAVGVVLVVMAVILILPPRYESESILRVKQQSPGGGAASMIEEMVPLAGLSLPGLSDGDVETEMGVLQSRRMVEAVVDSMGLHVALKRPFRARRSRLVRVVDAGPDAVRGTYIFRHIEGGVYSVQARRTRAPVTVPERVQVGEEFRVGNMVLLLEPEVADSPPREIRLKVNPFQRVATRLRKDLQISRQEGRSRLIDVAYRHTDPIIAAGVVNGLVEEYLAYSLSTEKYDSRRQVEILREQVASYQAELGEAEDRLQAFQERARIIAPEEQATQQVKRIAAVQAKRDAMEVERAALSRLIAQVGSRARGAEVPAPYRQLATFPSFISNAAVQDVLQALTELESQEAELLARRTEQNVDVRTVQARIRDLDEQIYRLGVNYLEGLDLQIESSATALARFGIELEAIPALEVELARLVREQRLLSEVYLLLQARLRETEVQEAIDDSDVRIVDEAVVAERPVFPRRGVSLVLASILGLMVGVTTVVTREMVDPTVRGPRDVRQAVGSEPWIVEVPPLHTTNRRGGNGTGLLLTRDDPWHPASERFHSVAARLFSAAEPPRVIVVSSAVAGEGRSSTAANLATALALQNRSVALLEGDLRNPGVAPLVGAPGRPGWTALRNGAHNVQEVAQPVPLAREGVRMDVYPGGLADGLHPAGVLSGPAMGELIRSLRDAYDVVVIDTPALALGPDAHVFTALAEATILVARSRVSTRPEISAASEQLRSSGAHLVGVVLTDVEASA